jgi:mono/diheme cytochrome c family protein
MLRASHKTLLILIFIMAFALAACGGGAAATTDSAPASENTAVPVVGDPATGNTAVPTNATPVEAQPAASDVSFSKDILPILESRCINCHGGQRTSEGLDMKTYESLIAGSNNGPVVTPGDAENSNLIQLVVKGKMPKRGPKLTPEQVDILKAWINAGAPNN